MITSGLTVTIGQAESGRTTVAGWIGQVAEHAGKTVVVVSDDVCRNAPLWATGPNLIGVDVFFGREVIQESVVILDVFVLEERYIPVLKRLAQDHAVYLFLRSRPQEETEPSIVNMGSHGVHLVHVADHVRLLRYAEERIDVAVLKSRFCGGAGARIRDPWPTSFRVERGAWCVPVIRYPVTA